MSQISIRLSNHADKKQADYLCEIINQVYQVAESGLFHPGLKRISTHEVIELIDKNELMIAEKNNQIVGCVHISIVDKETAKFGMLTADPNLRGTGIGKELVKNAEAWAKSKGCSIMELELLTPSTWKQPHKEFLKDWYLRMDYIPKYTKPFEKADILATPCDFTIYQKELI